MHTVGQRSTIVLAAKLELHDYSKSKTWMLISTISEHVNCLQIESAFYVAEATIVSVSYDANTYPCSVTYLIAITCIYLL